MKKVYVHVVNDHCPLHNGPLEQYYSPMLNITLSRQICIVYDIFKHSRCAQNLLILTTFHMNGLSS